MFLLGIFNFWFLKISGLLAKANPDPSTALRDPGAKAIVILDADNRITFATRIAGAILEGFYRYADPSTELRDPGRK